MGTRSEQFELLLGVLRYDIEKRYGVLKDEVRHLIGGIAYRIGTEPAAAAKKTSQAAFLNLLKRSAQSLSDECDEDLLEIDRYAKIRNHWRQSYTVVKPEGQNEFAILWQAKMLHKASVIAERIGDLHNRLEQFLQRTNPDHPDTTLRRRTEQGLTDKYLSELSRWAHRDLVIFVKSMGARYPYDEVPATFQFWAYDHTSRHHSFIGTQGHKDWVRRIEATPTPNSKGLHPSKFVSVALSYWMPERAALQPIIGHELAHQVLRDLYGREVNFAILEQDESLFARTYRRLTTCVETWSVARAVNGTIDVKLTSNLVHEVLCDVLAAVRFGYAYAFAWILEILGDVQLARLSHDHYGMLRQIEPARGGSTDVLELIKGPYRQLSDDVLKASEYLRDILPRNYIRGIVLLRFLGRSSNETDEASSEFATAFEDLLKELLKIFAGANTQQSDIESAFAGDLASALCDEWAFAEDDSLDSDFVNASRDLWRREGRSGGRHTNPSLDHQVITRGYRELVTSTLNNNADSMSCKRPGIPH